MSPGFQHELYSPPGWVTPRAAGRSYKKFAACVAKVRARCARLRWQRGGAICLCPRPRFCRCAWQLLSWGNRALETSPSSPVHGWDGSTKPHWISVLLILSAGAQVNSLTTSVGSSKTKRGRVLLTHPACGNVHSSDGNHRDSTSPRTESCFGTRRVKGTEVIHCRCLGGGTGCSLGSASGGYPCVSGTPSPSASWAEEELGPWVLRVEDPSLPSTTR